MATLTEIADLIARKTDRPFNEIRLYVRRLSEAGLLPKGSARKSPECNARHLAVLIAGILHTDVAKSAPLLVEINEEHVLFLQRFIEITELRQSLLSVGLDRRARWIEFLIPGHWIAEELVEGADCPRIVADRLAGLPTHSVFERNTNGSIEILVVASEFGTSTDSPAFFFDVRARISGRMIRELATMVRG